MHGGQVGINERLAPVSVHIHIHTHTHRRAQAGITAHMLCKRATRDTGKSALYL